MSPLNSWSEFPPSGGALRRVYRMNHKWLIRETRSTLLPRGCTAIHKFTTHQGFSCLGFRIAVISRWETSPLEEGGHESTEQLVGVSTLGGSIGRVYRMNLNCGRAPNGP